MIKTKIDEMKEKAANEGRDIRFGIRLHVIVRESEDEAWESADKLIKHVNDDTIKAFQDKFASFDSTAQKHSQVCTAAQKIEVRWRLLRIYGLESA